MRTIKNLIKKSSYISKFYRGIRDQLDKNDPFIRTPWGFKLSGNERMASGRFEPDEVKIVRDILAETDLFINAGANIGYYVCHALSLNNEVVAVEPVRRNVHYLMRNIYTNGWGNKVEIYPVAAGEKADILPMWGGNTGASLVKNWAKNSEDYVSYVPVVPLDRITSGLASGRHIFILADVEGFEYSLLKGAKKLLQYEPRPVWMVEISKAGHHPDKKNGNQKFKETFRIFTDAGYKIFRGDGFDGELQWEDIVEIDQRKESFSCNNFIFK